MTKIEWRKNDKALYLPTKKPTKIEVPEMNYLTIKGNGNPNGEAFQKNTSEKRGNTKRVL